MRPLLLALFLSPMASTSLAAQDDIQMPPAIAQIWGDRDSWQLFTPADVGPDKAHRLAALRNHRAVYIRETNMHAEPRRVVATFQFEDVMWQGKSAVLISWTETGDPLKDDDSASIISTVAEAGTLRSWRSVSNFGGDFTLMQASPDGIHETTVSDDGTSNTVTLEGDHPFFEMLARGHLPAMFELEAGMMFRLANYSASRNAVIGVPVYVPGKVVIRDALGREQDVWRTETLARRDGWVNIYYVSDHAPYFMGYDLKNVVTGEQRTRVRLLSVQEL